jgi:hypothetical protein
MLATPRLSRRCKLGGIGTRARLTLGWPSETPFRTATSILPTHRRGSCGPNDAPVRSELGDAVMSEVGTRLRRGTPSGSGSHDRFCLTTSRTARSLSRLEHPRLRVLRAHRGRAGRLARVVRLRAWLPTCGINLISPSAAGRLTKRRLRRCRRQLWMRWSPDVTLNLGSLGGHGSQIMV